MKLKKRDKPIKSIAKAISWRIIASLTTMSLVFIFTGELVLSLSIGFFEIILKMLFYYAHERVWDKTKWGIYK